MCHWRRGMRWVLKPRVNLIVQRRLVRPLRAIQKRWGVMMRSSWCRWLGLRFAHAGFWSGRVGCIRVAPSSVAKYGAAEISHCAGGPPGVAKAVQEVHALLELFGCAVYVDFEAAGAEVAVYDAESYT